MAHHFEKDLSRLHSLLGETQEASAAVSIIRDLVGPGNVPHRLEEARRVRDAARAAYISSPESHARLIDLHRAEGAIDALISVGGIPSENDSAASYCVTRIVLAIEKAIEAQRSKVFDAYSEGYQKGYNDHREMGEG